MSSTVQSAGFFVLLKTPVDKANLESLFEELHSATNGYLSPTYDGTMVYSDDFEKRPYHEREFNSDLFIVGQPKRADYQGFVNALAAAGLDVDLATVMPYYPIWYNGADSPMSDYTKEALLASL
jgi:hypothetical protein